MDPDITEQDLRREAIRRFLEGESRTTICRDLNRSPRWFDKWRAEYERNPRLDWADRSRAPHTFPQQVPDTVV